MMETMVLTPQDSLAQERHRYQSGAMAGVMYSYGGLPRTKRQQKAAAQVFATVPLQAENSFMQQQARAGLKAPQYRLHSAPAVVAVSIDSPLLPSIKQQHQFSASLTTPARNGTSAAPRHISRTRADGELQGLRKPTTAVEKIERRKPLEKNAESARNVSEKNQDRRKGGLDKKGTEKKVSAMSNAHDLSRQTAPKKPVVVTILQRPQTKEAVAEHMAKFANRSDESVQQSSHPPIQSALSQAVTKMMTDEAVRDSKRGLPDLIAPAKSGEVDRVHAEKSNNTSPKKLRLGRKKSGVKPVPAKVISDEDVPDSAGDVPDAPVSAKGGELARTHSGSAVGKVSQKKTNMFIKKASGEARGKTLLVEGEESVRAAPTASLRSSEVADVGGESEDGNSANVCTTSSKETTVFERKKALREFTGKQHPAPATVSELLEAQAGADTLLVAGAKAGLLEERRQGFLDMVASIRGGKPVLEQNVQSLHGGLSRTLSKSVGKVSHGGVGGLLSHSKSVGSVPSIAEGDLGLILGHSPDKTFERWAGPGYTNSPPPSTLPFPKFSIQRVTSLLTGVSLADLDSAGPQDMDSPSSASSSPSSPPSIGALFATRQPHVLDPTSATKDLRRMLNLDLDWSDDESLESVMVSSDSFSDLATQGLKRILQLS